MTWVWQSRIAMQDSLLLTAIEEEHLSASTTIAMGVCVQRKMILVVLNPRGGPEGEKNYRKQ